MSDIAHYFDYAAATPLLPEATAAMQPFFADNFYNPSALYLAARANQQQLHHFRQIIASGLGARPTEIIFTAGGTEANNLAIHGVLRANPEAHIVSTTIEHDSILEPVKHYKHTLVAVNDKGLVDEQAIITAITDETVLVSVMYANNEIGSIQPIREIAQQLIQIRKKREQTGNRTPLYFHTDACQAGNYLDMQVSRLGVDLLTINAGKMYGPKQTGALYVRAGIVLEPLIAGGGQEWNARSGTENLANISGFATAWQIIRSAYHDEARRVSQLRDECIANLKNAVPEVIINGPIGSKRLANNIHMTIPTKDNERLLMELDESGFQVATGSACSASNDEPSHILKAIGISDEQARSSIRITLGRYSNESAVQELVKTIAKKVALS